MTRYHELVEREVSLDGVIDSLLLDLEERFRTRPLRANMTWDIGLRAMEIMRIRGLVRAVRILRGAGR